MSSFFDGKHSYAKDIAKYIFSIFIILFLIEGSEYFFRIEKLHDESEKNQLVILANKNMRISSEIIEESIWFIVSKKENEREKKREKLKLLLEKYKEAHFELIRKSYHTGMLNIAGSPIIYMERYYKELTEKIASLLTLHPKVLSTLAEDSFIVREFLAEDPDSEEESKAFTLDIEKLSDLFSKSNRERETVSSNFEDYILFFKIITLISIVCAIYFVIRKGHIRDIDFHSTHNELQKERDKLAVHHKEDELNIETAKLLFSLINGFLPRYLTVSDGISLFCENNVNHCHKEGGDHSGIIKTKDCIFFYNADESGHEVSTVMWSIVSAILYKRAVKIESDSGLCFAPEALPRIMENLNNALCHIYPEGHFCTMLTGIIDTKSLELHYTKAAHPEFYIIRGSKVIVLPEDDKNYKGDVFLGILENSNFGFGKIQLQKGDKLIVLTDGFYEAEKSKNGNESDFFGFNRIRDVVTKSATLPVHEIYENICREVANFTGKAFGTVVKEDSENPGHYHITTKNELLDDATAFLLQIEDMYDFQQVFEISPNSYREVQEETRKIWEKHIYPAIKENGFMESSRMNIQLVLEEAVINSFEHGHKKKPLPIKIGYKLSNDLIIHVFDQGNGVDVAPGLLDITTDSQIENPRGRGIFLIKNYASEAKWYKVNQDHYKFCVRIVFRKVFNQAEKQHVEKIRNMSLLKFNSR